MFQHLAIRSSYHDRASTIGAVIQVYSGNHGRTIVFCATKKDADELAISDDIKQVANVLHGDIPQDKREMVLKVGDWVFRWLAGSLGVYFLSQPLGRIFL